MKKINEYLEFSNSYNKFQKLALTICLISGAVYLSAQENRMAQREDSLYLDFETRVNKTIEEWESTLHIEKEAYGELSPEYAFSLSFLGSQYASIGNYSEAIRLETEAKEIRIKVLGSEHPYYVSSLMNLSDYYSAIGNYPEALQLKTEALGIYKKLGAEVPPNLLNDLANCYSALGNLTEAIKYETEALELYKKTLGTEHPAYATILSNLAFYLSYVGNYTESIRLETEALEIRRKAFGEKHPDFALSLNNLALYNSYLGNFTDALRLGTEAMQIRKDLYGVTDPDFAASLINLALFNSQLGNYSESIKLGTEAMNIFKIILGSDHQESDSHDYLVFCYNGYITSVNNLASNYCYIGNYPEAINLEMKAMDISRTLFGTENPYYAQTIANLAHYYFRLGNYTEAIRLGSEALEIYRRIFGTEHPEYALVLSNLGTFYSEVGNYTEAIRLSTESMEIRKKLFGPNNSDYATSVAILANHYSDMGKYAEALRLYTEAMEIKKVLLGTKHPDYAALLTNISLCNEYLGNFTEALRVGKEALDIKKEVLGTSHYDYALSLNNLSNLYANLGNFSESYHYMLQSLRSTRDCILLNFSGLSSGLQESLWSTSISDRFHYLFPSSVYRCQSEESISELYDMTALFAKGILLNTSVEMRKLILESGDSSLVTHYDQLVSNKVIYDKQMEKPISERAIDTDSLRLVIDRQEMELARDSKTYGDFSHNLRITWKDVQEKLEDDVIAIEFLEFPFNGTDSTMYIALTLKKDYDSPHMFPLFEESQLDSIPEDDLYTESDLYDLVWKPLESELYGVRDIYFSPSGKLHNIGIEYVPVTSTENICDRYKLHRLSSTRQLALIQSDIMGDGGVLYGGLDYNAAIERGHINTSSINREISYINVPRAIVDSLDIRGSLSYLPSTKEEAEKIALDMKRHKVPCAIYIGRDGTEESFKQLGGTRPRILHIATHGFYLTEEEAGKKLFARMMLRDADQTNREDKPMTRSGLLLSGCLPALNHDTIPDEVEDGILTAQEISKLDLRGLDLVVLSACQTGLGDIVSGEGVFGLQRGFKNAGARTIVMSLWKVDDKATMDLMVSFYGHYLKGMSKEESFRLAREELRKKSEPGYARPDWAAFVMLDDE